MKLIEIGDTTFSSDPLKRHHSYTVYATRTGGKFYAHIHGYWYYARPVHPIGFDVGGRVPRNIVAQLTGGLLSIEVRRSRRRKS